MPRRTRTAPQARRLDRIEERLLTLIGEGSADFFQSARRLVADGGVAAQSNLVWHCAREIEGSILLALGPVAPLDPNADPKAKRAAQVAAITKHLDLPTGDAAIAWWRTSALHKGAHRNNLGPIRPLSVPDWLTFTQALELILDHFEARYNKMLERLDAVLALGPTTGGDEAKDLLCALPPTGRASALAHFLGKAGPDWLEVLPGCVFHDPAGLMAVRDQPGYVSIPGWPVSEYLSRIAPAEPHAVHARMMEILAKKPANPSIHRDMTVALRSFSLPDAETWAAAEADWLRAQSNLFLGLAHDLTLVVEWLGSQGLKDAAFNVADALLRLDPAATSHRYGEPGLRMDDYDYEESFTKVAATLSSMDAMRAFDTLEPIVVEAIALAHPHDAEYGSLIWLDSVEGLPTDPHPTTVEVMLEALRKVAEAAATDAAALSRIAGTLLSRQARNATVPRLAIHVVREKRALDASAPVTLLANPATFDHNRWPELVRLVEQVVPTLPPAELAQTRTAIEASTLHETEKEALLAHIVAAESGAAALAPAQLGNRFTFGRDTFTSPVPVETLKQWPVQRVVAHISGYVPDPSVWRDGSTLGADLSGVVKARPTAYSGAGTALLALGERWSTHVFYGLQQALTEGTGRIRWSPLVVLIADACSSGSPWSGPGYAETRKAALWLIEQGLQTESFSLSPEARQRLWLLLAALIGDPDPSPATESKALASDGGLASLSINSIRPIAMTAAARLGVWTTRRRAQPRRLPTEARMLMESQLSPASRSLVVRFALGERIPSLFATDPDWTLGALPSLLPVDPALADLREAGWSGYLSAHHYSTGIIPAMLGAYAAAVESMSGRPARNDDATVAGHIVQFALLGLIGPSSEDGLLVKLLDGAPVDAVESALDQVGRSFYAKHDAGIDPAEAARALLIWDAATAEVAAGRADPAMLSGFAWWFASGFTDDDWLFAELQRLVATDIFIDGMHVVWQRLRQQVLVRAGDVGRVSDLIIARSGSNDHLYDREIRAVIKALLSTPPASEGHICAESAVNRMKARGFSRFPED